MEAQSNQVFLVGNPNVGKSVIFHALTGTYATVSNYPGTTVALTQATMSIGGEAYTLVDTPGIHSLLPMSEDEKVTRDLLLDRSGCVIQVADARNLARSLSLTLQLQEMGVRLLLVVNMCDEAKRVGIQIDGKQLEKMLGVPVVMAVAVRGLGIPEIREKVKQMAVPKIISQYSSAFEKNISSIIKKLPADLSASRFWAIMLLSGDRNMGERIKEKISASNRNVIEEECRILSSQFAEPIGSLFSRFRKDQVRRILQSVLSMEQKGRLLGEWLGRWTVHPFWGLISLLVVLEVVYLFVGKLGAGTLVNFVENGIFKQYISPTAVHWVGIFLPSTNAVTHFLHESLVGTYGLITMGMSYGFAIVLPIVTTFFIAFSLMEDSGYLPRLAVMVDRIFQWMGLNGKAVLPMVLGLGCDTMATLTTRILETKKQRIIVSLLLALAVPCSAQLGVLLGMFAQMPFWAFWIWMGLILGIVFVVGFITSKILPGPKADFVMEIPPLRLPLFGNVLKKTLSRLEWYIKEAIPLFLLGTFFLFLLDYFQLLGLIQKAASPLVVSFLDLPREATNAFLIGFLRRDYGATGFFDMFSSGQMTTIQALVSLVVITLFIPCIANVFMLIKEHGNKITTYMVLFIFPFAFLVGGALNWVLHWIGA